MLKLSFEDPSHWRDIDALRRQPPPTNQGELANWIHYQSVGTPHSAEIKRRIDWLRSQHGGGSQPWVAISGEAHLGKTNAITRVLLENALKAELSWMAYQDNDFQYLPYVFVTAGPQGEALALMRSIAHFCGLPSTGKNTQDLHRTLSTVLPSLGTEVVVIDDAHFLRRVGASASRVTDGLRNLLHLPVAFVFVGVDLHRSALLRDPGRNNDSVRQLQRRAHGVVLSPLDRPQDATALKRAISTLAARLSEVKELGLDGIHDPVSLRALVQAYDYRPGSILEALKRSAVEALSDDGVISAERLRGEAERAGVEGLAAG